jgi:hypothetical protein
MLPVQDQSEGKPSEAAGSGAGRITPKANAIASLSTAI